MSAATASAPTRRVRARGRVVIEPGRDGRPRLRSCRTEPPLGVRAAGGEIHLLGTAGGPLGGDDLGLQVVVAPGTHVTVRSVAATVLLPGDGGVSRQQVTVEVGAGAELRWLPEPVVAAVGCRHVARADVQLAEDARLVWSDELVLGRSGEDAGELVSTVRVERAGRVLVHHEVDTTRRAWVSPATTAGMRAVGFLARVGPDTSDLPASVQGIAHTVHEDGLATVTAIAPDAAVLRARLAPYR